jgi:hypothetical protein
MSNLIIGGWSALEHELHTAVEFASNCAGPDGAKERVKHGVSMILAKFKGFAIAEAEKLAPVAEAAAAKMIDTTIQAATPVIEEKIGEPGASIVEAGLQAVAGAGETIAAQAISGTLEHLAEAPVVEAPVVEAPVVEAPVVEAPVVEAPVVEAPVAETSTNEVQ